MNTKITNMTKDQANAVYQVLIDECGADQAFLGNYSFVDEFTSNDPCHEYRFQGSLGFGGKFRFPRMSVDCYLEDETPERLASIESANKKLATLKESFDLDLGVNARMQADHMETEGAASHMKLNYPEN